VLALAEDQRSLAELGHGRHPVGVERHPPEPVGRQRLQLGPCLVGAPVDHEHPRIRGAVGDRGRRRADPVLEVAEVVLGPRAVQVAVAVLDHVHEELGVAVTGGGAERARSLDLAGGIVGAALEDGAHAAPERRVPAVDRQPQRLRHRRMVLHLLPACADSPQFEQVDDAPVAPLERRLSVAASLGVGDHLLRHREPLVGVVGVPQGDVAGVQRGGEGGVVAGAAGGVQRLVRQPPAGIPGRLVVALDREPGQEACAQAVRIGRQRP
jgi:hypothetical protein